MNTLQPIKMEYSPKTFWLATELNSVKGESCIALCSWFCVRSSIINVSSHFCSFPAFFCHSLSQSHTHASNTHSSSAPLLHHVLLHSLSRHTTQGVTEWVRGVRWWVFAQPLSAFTLCVPSSGCWGVWSPRPHGGDFDLNHPDTAHTQPLNPKHWYLLLAH